MYSVSECITTNVYTYSSHSHLDYRNPQATLLYSLNSYIIGFWLQHFRAFVFRFK